MESNILTDSHGTEFVLFFSFLFFPPCFLGINMSWTGAGVASGLLHFAAPGGNNKMVHGINWALGQ